MVTRDTKDSDILSAFSHSPFSRKYGSLPRWHECYFYSLIPSSPRDKRKEGNSRTQFSPYLNSDWKIKRLSCWLFRKSSDKYRDPNLLCTHRDGWCFQHLGEYLHFSGSSKAFKQCKELLNLLLMTFDIACTFDSIPGKKREHLEPESSALEP